jgi:hypothetical protein
MNIVLESSDKSLDEVVVIGYGTMKRRDLTGAVASVTGDKLAQNPVSNIAEALQGQLLALFRGKSHRIRGEVIAGLQAAG